MGILSPKPAAGLFCTASSDDHATAGVFRFDDFELDLGVCELRRAGHPIGVGSQTFSLLVELVRNAGRTVTRDELAQRIWPGVRVSEGSLRQAIWEVRQALGDDAVTPRYVRTLRGRGYCFVGDVTVDAPAVAALPAPRTAASSLVGRSAELGRLRAALDGALAESGRACLVRGAPGLGKSRLARELVHHARAHGVLCLEGYAERDAGVPPFWPWIQLLHGFLQDLSAGDRARYEESAPLAFQLVARGVGSSGARPVLFSDSPDLRRLYLFEELTRLLELVARETPLLLLLEDIHWLDDASTAFLRYFLGALPRGRVLLVLTCRTFARGQNRPLARAVDTLARGALNELLDLEPLGPSEIAELLERAGSVAPSPAVAAHVHGLTSGNPLFALEVTRLLGGPAASAEARLERDSPELRGVIRRRLESLPERCLEAALAASVWGGECGVALLSTLLDESLDDTLERVDECVRRGVLLEGEGPLRFRFSHPLLAEVAYELLSGAERRRLHGAAGLWLERQNDGQLAQLSALAHHFFLAATASVAQRAVDYAKQCAERAYTATAYEMASAHCERALSAAELLADFPPAERLALELARAEARHAVDSLPDARAVFAALAERATQLGQAKLLARAALGYSGQRPAGAPLNIGPQFDPLCAALLERARAAVDPADQELRALLACALSLALGYGPERERREALADEALDLARAVGTPVLVAHVLSFRPLVCAAPGAHESVRAAIDELVEIAHVNGLKEVELGGRLMRVVSALGVGDLQSATLDDARARALSERLGSPRARMMSELFPTLRAFWRGDIDEAERLSNGMFQALRADTHHQALHIARQAVIGLLRGGYAYLPPLITQLEGLLATFPETVSCHCTLASAYAAVGQHDAARAHFDRAARDDFRAIPENYHWLAEMIALADGAVRLHDVERAQLVHRRLLPFADRLAFYQGRALPAGSVARALAELSTVLGDFAAASRFLRTSRALHQRLGAVMFLHYDALSEVRLLTLRRPSGWLARTTPLLDEVAGFARTAGVRWLEDYALELGRAQVTQPFDRARQRLFES